MSAANRLMGRLHMARIAFRRFYDMMLRVNVGLSRVLSSGQGIATRRSRLFSIAIDQRQMFQWSIQRRTHPHYLFFVNPETLAVAMAAVISPFAFSLSVSVQMSKW